MLMINKFDLDHIDQLNYLHIVDYLDPYAFDQFDHFYLLGEFVSKSL